MTKISKVFAKYIDYLNVFKLYLSITILRVNLQNAPNANCPYN